MKGKWEVMRQYAGGETLIRVYRLRDVNEVKHAGNLEFYGEFYGTDEEAEKIANELNGKETE